MERRGEKARGQERRRKEGRGEERRGKERRGEERRGDVKRMGRKGRGECHSLQKRAKEDRDTAPSRGGWREREVEMRREEMEGARGGGAVGKEESEYV